MSLSWTSPIQSIYPRPTSWRSILISTHLRLGLPSGLLPSGFLWLHTNFITYLLTCLLTYLLAPWCRVLLEKLTGLQLVKKFPAYHGTRRFITALTSVRQLSLSWTSPIQSIYPHPTSRRSILIVSTHLRLGLPSGLPPSGFPTKTLYTPSPHPYAPLASKVIRKINRSRRWRIGLWPHKLPDFLHRFAETRGIWHLIWSVFCDHFCCI